MFKSHRGQTFFFDLSHCLSRTSQSRGFRGFLSSSTVKIIISTIIFTLLRLYFLKHFRVRQLCSTIVVKCILIICFLNDCTVLTIDPPRNGVWKLTRLKIKQRRKSILASRLYG